jgi:hypothetical protein
VTGALGSAGILDDSVQRDEFGDHDASHSLGSLVEWLVRSGVE